MSSTRNIGKPTVLKFNLAGREIFIETQKELLGEKNSYWMAALTKLKEKSAFKIYAKSQMVDFTTTNAITAALEQYEKAIKNLSDDDQLIDEEDGHEIDVYDYIPKEYHEIYNYSKKYQGIIDAVSPHPCFSEGSLVMTNKGYKEIQDIQKGDFVLTHTNSFKEVVNTMKHRTDDIVKIKATGVHEIKTTPNHPFLCIEKECKENQPLWKNAIDLRSGDFIGFPINTNSIIPSWDGVFDGGLRRYKNEIGHLMNNKDFWWIVGRYIGDGWLQLAKKKTGEIYGYRTFICCNKNNEETNDISTILDKISIKYRIQTEKTTNKIIMEKKELYVFLEQFGKYAHGKRLTNTIFDLPVYLLESFIDGYMSADGHSQSEKQDGFTTVSKELAYGISSIIHKVYKVGIKMYIDNRDGEQTIDGRIVICRKRYKVVFPKKDSDIKTESFYRDNYIWTPITNTKLIDSAEYVYNFSVKDDESYTVQNIAVHNCAFLVTNDPITRSFGLMRVKDEIVCMVEGGVADSWKYVKNDLLSVSVWAVIGNIFKRINKPIMTVNELLEAVKDDEKVWGIYEKGITMCINQVEQPASKQAVMKYKPTNISELTAFTSAVRPGFKSMFSKFLSRDTFDYGIKLVDDLIQTPEMPYSYILYQETVMKLLVFAGFEEAETMLIIKAISKKVKEKIMKAQNRFIAGLSKRLEETGESKESSRDKAEKMWQIIEDSSRYSSLGRLAQ